MPLKSDKIKAVKQQLSSIQPEVLLFLSKIKQFSVKEVNKDPSLNTVNAISISSEINFVTRKNIDADSYTLYLSTDEASDVTEKECGYYMWRQKFPVGQKNRVERRLEVEEWVITLAFPFGERLNRGMSSPGVYAFLPTEMVTNFPFIIQADFVLASSRETILLDNKWNQGILARVPSAFVNAFNSLITTSEDVPVSTLIPMFRFLPVCISSYPMLNVVRELIKKKLLEENIIPCQSYSDQKIFRKPCEVSRLTPSFWDILKKGRKQGVSLHSLSSHGRYILNSSFDTEEYDDILNFLGVEPVNSEWYAKCIRSSNLVLGVAEENYLELLLFIAENWGSSFHRTDMENVPLLKYVGPDGVVVLCSVSNVTMGNGASMICMSSESRHISWMIDWNREFRRVTDRYFMPKSTQEAIGCFSKRGTLLEWLKNQVKVCVASAYDFAVILYKSLMGDQQLVIAYVHFLYHSLSQCHLKKGNVDSLCDSIPLVDNYGHVITQRNGVLVPANGSKWVELMGANPWRELGYVELGEDYLRPATFAGTITKERQLMTFLKTHVAASDIPDISPPNTELSAAYAPLTKQNAFMLLDWIHSLRYKRDLPAKFLTSITTGRWLKISLSGSPGYRPPSQSFLFNSSAGDLLQDESVMVDIPLIDQEFYGNGINNYKEELKTIGVMFEYREVCQFVGKHVMSLATSSALTKSNVFQILNFIRFLRLKVLPADEFIHSIRDGRWLKTSCGDRSPVGSVLFDQEWRAASQISDIPFIDQNHYGKEILRYEMELQLLGVVVGFNKNYQLVTDHLKSQACSKYPTAEAILLIFECMCHCERNSRSYNKLLQALKGDKCLKTNKGYKFPSECFLPNTDWDCLLKVFSNDFPLIDEDFYGTKILSYRNELKQAGVVVEFELAAQRFSAVFKNRASSSSFGREHVLSFLSSYRQISNTNNQFPSDFRRNVCESKWLQTRLGVPRSPKECILFGPEWEPVSSITLLPFIDDSDNYYGQGIHEYRKELKRLGVTIKFKDGVKYVAACICFPQDPSTIAPESVLSLLQCIQILRKDGYTLTDAFQKKVSQSWIKTVAGYKSPDQSLLFGSNWGSLLRRNDGPFIDQEFYGNGINNYKEELKTIGVTVEVSNGCSLIASYLDFHSEFSTIVRVYNYLHKKGWWPSDDTPRRIWIPNGSHNGVWIGPEKCVIHDKDGLFGSELNVLEKHYKSELFAFFSGVMRVKSHPSVDDYFELWKDWEDSKEQLSHSECSSFWAYISKHWSKSTEKTLSDRLSKVPVESGSDGMLLSSKHDVFIADDLQLKHLFKESSPDSIFVWYPQPSIPSLPRTKLLDIYSKIGVRKISESVHKEDITKLEASELKQVPEKGTVIGKGLLKLILGFLADPSMEMEAGQRQEAVKGLLDLKVFETESAIEVSYKLSMSSGNIKSVNASRVMRWDWEDSKLFMQKKKSGGHKNKIEYATIFAKVISEGVLREKEEHIDALSELIKLAFLLDFDEEVVGYLMRSKNIQVFMEDEEFLSSAFSMG